MIEGIEVVDADRHVYEPIEMWAEYLPAKFRDFAPRFGYFEDGRSLSDRMVSHGPSGEIAMPPDMLVGDQRVINLSPSAKRDITMAALERPEDLKLGEKADTHLAAMDKDGIDKALMLPTYASYLVVMDHKELGLGEAFADGYNRWLADLCAADESRLVGAAIACRTDPAGLMSAAKFALDKGWPAIALRPNPVAGRLLGHEDNMPFWHFCADNGLVVVTHEGAHSNATTVGADRFDTRFSQHACSHPLEQMMAFLSLLECGIMEDRPDLRIAILEAGCGWIVNWLWRLDNVEYDNTIDELHGKLCRPPSEYFKRQCIIGFEPSEPMLEHVVDFLGADRMVFGSDFPHLDHEDNLVQSAMQLNVSAEDRAKLMGGTAASFFRL